jgi:hypothetical protein
MIDRPEQLPEGRDFPREIRKIAICLPQTEGKDHLL